MGGVEVKQTIQLMGTSESYITLLMEVNADASESLTVTAATKP